MKTTFAALLAGIACLAATAQAANLPGHMGGRSLIETKHLPRVSMGVTAELLNREVRIDNDLQGELEGNAFSAYLGIDAFRWITVYGTAGAMFLDSLESDVDSDNFDEGLRWTAGLNASLWHVDTTEPEFMRGRFSIGLVGEYSDTTAAGDSEDITWTETAVALPISFEIPNEPMLFWGVESLLLYAGPLYTDLSGSAEVSNLKFEGRQDGGVLAGADIYFAKNVCLGARVLIVDGTSIGIAARYHF